MLPLFSTVESVNSFKARDKGKENLNLSKAPKSFYPGFTPLLRGAPPPATIVMAAPKAKYWLMKAEPDSRIVKGKDVKVPPL
jgi:hypothetical protein